MGGGVFFFIKDFLVYNEMRWKQEEFKMISQIVGYLVDLVMGFQISYTSGKKNYSGVPIILLDKSGVV
jgi:hypothetical protein